MNTAKEQLSGGQLIVKALQAQGVTHLFSVPGESFLDVLDALYDSDINNIVCRQEGGAAMMAEAWGKATGTPGICFVTRGPGATNASAGIHIADQDSTPMILFVGQINSGNRHREGFQELDYRQVFGTMTKWVAEIDSAARVTEMVARAWAIATAGRPGPVVLVLPEDALCDTAIADSMPQCTPVPSYPHPQQVEQMVTLLDQADNPMVIVGGSGWSKEACDQLADFVTRFNLPVACSFRRQMLFDHQHSHYAGDAGLGINPQLAQRIKQADVLLLINTRFSEVAAQNYTLINIPSPAQSLIHIHSGAEELGKLYTPTIGMRADPISLMPCLTEYKSTGAAKRKQYLTACHASYKAWSQLPDRHYPGTLQMPKILQIMQAMLPADSIITNGAGNYASWIHRFWPFRNFGSQLAPTSGSMGYGLPAAIAAKLACPDRTVVGMAGDGCFQMTMQELASAVQAQVQIIIMVVDNGIYGTIRMHQEKRFPQRVSGTDMVNPNFAELAKAYGIYSARIEHHDDFAPALQQAQNTDGPALLHLVLNKEVITPQQTLSEISGVSKSG
ncbi:MAG: thiamine pyrophosphate-binding protein [Gammaproteobacteria bacterium]|nr:thiamine pyrophosphate-binding protein [Gammaproteobacteria bacterium]